MASKVPSWMISAQLSSHTHTHILSLSLLPSFSLFPLPHPMARPSLSSLAITPPCVFLTSHLHPVQTIYIKDFSAHTFHHRSHFETLTLPPLSPPLSPTKNHHYINSQTISGRWFIRGFAQTWRQKGSWPDYTNLSRSSSSGATWKAVIILSECFKSWRVIIRISR